MKDVWEVASRGLLNVANVNWVKKTGNTRDISDNKNPV
jgi:hypothetical protein